MGSTPTLFATHPIVVQKVSLFEKPEYEVIHRPGSTVNANTKSCIKVIMEILVSFVFQIRSAHYEILLHITI